MRHHPSSHSRSSSARVLVVLTSANRRGAETEGRNVAIELARRGFEAAAVALSPTTSDTGLDVDVLGPAPLHLSTLRALRRKATSAEIVIAFGSSALPACAFALAGIKARLVYRNIGNPSDWVRGPTHRWRTRMLFYRAHHVAALWPGASESIGALYGIPPEHRSVIPNFRSRDSYPPITPAQRASARAALSIRDSDRVIAFVGALSREKDAERAIRATAELADARLIVAGDGPMRSPLEALAAHLLPGRVDFLGSVADVGRVYAATDVVLLTSHTEGMPGVLIEAALSRVPAVTTDVGAAAEVVLDSLTGRVVDAKAEPREIARALDEVLTDRESMGSRAHTHALAHFETDGVITKWIDLLRSEFGASDPRGFG